MTRSPLIENPSHQHNERNGIYLAPELWLSILESGVLESENIRNTTLVCGQLRSLAQPLLFRKFSVTHYVQLGPVHTHFAQTTSYINRMKDRLRFISSDRINSAVRSLFIASKLSLPPPAGQDLIDSPGALDTLFDTLLRLSHVTSIHWCDCAVTPLRARGIYRLPNLRVLSLRGRVLKSGSGGTRAQGEGNLEKLDLIGSEENPLSPLFVPWTPLLSHKAIQHIRMADSESSHAFLEWLRHGPPVPQLRFIAVNPSSLRSPHFPGALAHCSALRTLSFIYIGDPVSVPLGGANVLDRLLGTGIVPHLQSVLGIPPEYAFAFVRHCPLTRLTVPSCMDANTAVTLLPEIPRKLPYLRELSLTLSTFISSWFPLIVELPALENLNLFIPFYDTFDDSMVHEVSVLMTLNPTSSTLL